jgi:pimeloyl-ACP methyl ester carboxylesterase
MRAAIFDDSRTAKRSTSGITYVDVGVDSGTMPPCLLIHGLGANLLHWSGVVSELATKRRVVAIDIPGLGDSSVDNGSYSVTDIVDQISDLIQDLGLQRACVVGHSLGGLFALLVAERFPFTSVILIDAHLMTGYEVLNNPQHAFRNPKITLGLLGLVAGISVPGRRHLVRWFADSAVGRKLLFGSIMAKPGDLDPSLLTEAFSRSTPRGVLRMLRALRHVDIINLMQNSGSNFYLVWGADDPLISAEDTAAAQQLIKPRKSIPIADSGHTPMLEQPQELVSVIQQSC